MERLATRIDRIVEYTLVLLMATMVMVVTWQVFTRFVLNNPSSFTEELSTYLLIWISLIGAAYAYRKGAHLGIDFLYRMMKPLGRRVTVYIQGVAVIIFSLLALVIGGIRLVYITLALHQTSAALRIPIGYIYAVLPISGLLLIFYAIIFMLNYNRKQHVDV
ncbi:TRAP transporter small permease [Rhodothermus profundi]|uniref:TRAP-type C4-dicarboxylate transport system, small permease component n=1 Tax=Rhodothermus profundi TaxID=633813 RepID=A0A1M6SZE1_9BACT|nr:TRAP transporter small permease [Rhodothermus profundi]SHK50085.1 TRAP-type C4-dicarboxylate transport system, small permease component [Rhodothermus profundi]